jgi:hypothetical protein
VSALILIGIVVGIILLRVNRQLLDVITTNGS